MTADWFRDSEVIGDVNQDGILDVLDIIFVIDFIMGFTIPSELEFQRADINNDALVDILDIVAMVTIIMTIDWYMIEFDKGLLSGLTLPRKNSINLFKIDNITNV